MSTLDAAGLDLLFRTARTQNSWKPDPVSDDILKQLVDLTVLGPTSANCEPLRIVFVKTPAAKERLKPALSAGNLEKTMSAPVTAILATDHEFYEQLPKLFPHADAKAWFVGNKAFADTAAFRNSSIQGGYFILAARALGLDTGAMSGFDQAKVDEEFFAGTSYKSNFLCNLGYGDNQKIFPRSPRLTFDETAKII